MFTTRPELLGRHGMVASTHWLASATGMAVLERGGNAADAAVAAGFVLQVVEPHLNGLGGEVPILVAAPGDALPDVICGQGTVPQLATIARFHELGIDPIPGSGLLAACVPGAFDAWMLLLRDRGTLSVGEVLAPARDYAGVGYPLAPRAAATVAACAELFTESWPTSAEVYLPGGRPPSPNGLFRNPALAETYGRLAAAAGAAGADRRAGIEAARDAFLRGFVAEAVDDFVQRRPLRDGSGRAHTGLLRGEDMAAWHATVEAPATIDHAGMRVCKPGPWSQGPVLLQQLALLDALRIAEREHNSADWVHTVIEAAKLAFADREAWYGDSDVVEVPLEALLDPAYAVERSRLVDKEAASLELRPGAPGGRSPSMPPQIPAPVVAALPTVLDALAGEPTLGPRGVARGDTCHVDVVDRDGMMVSATPSGGWLQSSPVIPGLGFSLGTRAQMCWLHEGLPSSLRPGRRPRTTLSPTLCMRDGRPALSIGTPGGDQQDQWQLVVLLAHLHAGMNLQEAIDAPAFHTNHMPSSFDPREAHPGEVVVESRLDVAVVDELLRRGHRLVVDGPWSLGRVSAVARDADGLLRAAANPRGMQGYAVGR
jgi:gamma-glutamyltranspeptidase / glutathione hydrolase